MHIVHSDLWNELKSKNEEQENRKKSDLILVTTNSELDRNGYLIMGAGAALEAKKRFPDLPERFGSAISSINHSNELFPYYGVLVCSMGEGETDIGAFQTKYACQRKSPLELIELSAHKLVGWSMVYEKISLNFPAIGKGGLTFESVFPLISWLPDNIYFFRNDKFHEQKR